MNKNITQETMLKLRHLFQKNKVLKAYFFGSILTSNFNEQSDVDFIIDFEEGIDPIEKGTLWWFLHDELRKIFNREVDIINEQKIKNPFFKEEISQTKQLIYGR